jgi:hypothetical protein
MEICYIAAYALACGLPNHQGSAPAEYLLLFMPLPLGLLLSCSRYRARGSLPPYLRPLFMPCFFLDSLSGTLTWKKVTYHVGYMRPRPCRAVSLLSPILRTRLAQKRTRVLS